MNEILIDVPQEYEGERIDKFLSVLVEDASRNSIQKQKKKTLSTHTKHSNTTAAIPTTSLKMLMLTKCRTSSTL